MKTLKIISKKEIGISESVDLEVEDSSHNFYAEGLVTSNSHACAYSMLTASTAWLKAKYPKEFFLSLLKMTKHEGDSIAEIAKIHPELIHFGIKLLPPHIYKSKVDFSIEGNDIRFGLSSIKGVAGKTIEKLQKFRKENANKLELFESAKEAKIDIGTLCSFIQAGLYDEMSMTRVRMVYEAQLWNILTEKEKLYAKRIGEKFKYDVVEILKELPKMKDDKGKAVIKESRLETLRKKAKPYIDIYRLNKVSSDFANWYYENRLLGYSASVILREIFKSVNEDLISIQEVNDAEVESHVSFIGKISEIKAGKSREKGNPYIKLIVNDETGGIKVMAFEKAMKYIQESHQGKLPEEDDVVIVEGQKKDGTVFANNIATQKNRIYTRLSELKNLEEEDKSLCQSSPNI